MSCGVRARKALFYKVSAGSDFLSGSVVSKDFFTFIAKQLELELPDSFFELGNLCQDSLALNFYMAPTLSGSPEEREKYRKIKKLRETISKALEWAPIEKAFSGMKCIKLAV